MCVAWKRARWLVKAVFSTFWAMRLSVHWFLYILYTSMTVSDNVTVLTYVQMSLVREQGTSDACHFFSKKAIRQINEGWCVHNMWRLHHPFRSYIRRWHMFFQGISEVRPFSTFDWIIYALPIVKRRKMTTTSVEKFVILLSTYVLVSMNSFERFN